MKYQRTSVYGEVKEGPLGIPMQEDTARYIEGLIKDLPSELKSTVEKGPIRKSSPAFVDPDFETRTEVSVVTMNTLDRDNEIICPKGIDWSQWNKNPVVTWNHNYGELPPARGLWVKAHSKNGKEGYIAKSEYIERPGNWEGPWFADAVWHYVKSGFLPGKSIGFIPVQFRDPTGAELETHKNINRVFTKTVALEYAICPVQSNPDAMLESIEKGINPFPVILKECGLFVSDSVLKGQNTMNLVNKQWYNARASLRVMKANPRERWKIDDLITKRKVEFFTATWGYPIADGFLSPVGWDYWSELRRYTDEQSKVTHASRSYIKMRALDSFRFKDAMGVYRFVEKNTILQGEKQSFLTEDWGILVANNIVESVSWEYWKSFETNSGAGSIIKLFGKKMLDGLSKVVNS